MDLIQGLPTSSIAAIVRSLSPRLFIDFVQYLPDEVCLRILSYLDVKSIIDFSRTCKRWYNLSLDSRLWRQLYHLEGWFVSQPELLKLERWANSSQLNSRSIDFQFSAKRAPHDNDVEMSDPGAFSSSKHTQGFTDESTAQYPPTIDETRPEHAYLDRPTIPEQSDLFKMTLWTHNRYNDQFRVNWKYLFMMRCRLEKNWATKRYTNLQFPNPRYPDEAHEECVYSLQFTHDYMVSGSRDKTLRIWDMKTQRLVRPPLCGHQASVLCLQFDASPEQDIIISGSSDSDVIVWRFSTGEILQKLDTAHRESVLNLRFDNRVLVTCSKDTTIKVFNRFPLKYGDPGYGPGDPEYLSKVPITVKRYGFENGPADYMPIRPPYEVIATLKGHTAPVNAVQIHGKEVVSASGDRLIKVWDWEKNACIRTVQGHTKGIACVQYDGRRIVSGSSDNEIKIFDSRTGAVVTRLEGHRNLVRTVQAGFGDLPYSLTEDEEEARKIDMEYDHAVATGAIEDPSRPHRPSSNRQNIPGSRQPDQILSRGAKIPPNGGGGPHARIVSGSYDQEINVWRKNREGIWGVHSTLHQQDAILNAQMAEAQKNLRGIPVQFSTMIQWQEFCESIIHGGVARLQQAITQNPALLLLFNLFSAAIDRILVVHERQALRTELENCRLKYAEAVQIACEQELTDQVIRVPLPGGRANFEIDCRVGPQLSLEQMMHRLDLIPARIFKVQFDATRIIACTHKTTIVAWDFCNAERELLALRRVFNPIS
ncbi:hypothetical protein TD95_005111 [Thielaviopsis punctulata]|uniref:F-box domain-containing protein n=1 Tax=Thielaviopsis punctulata TaxID=72032 RepID=A0A0F4ZHT9_9PEZI|nr:hypothetical protein TD95_005111 [Thielaviopsis punctulata]